MVVLNACLNACLVLQSVQAIIKQPINSLVLLQYSMYGLANDGWGTGFDWINKLPFTGKHPARSLIALIRVELEQLTA
jgi:hypothetical protein